MNTMKGYGVIKFVREKCIFKQKLHINFINVGIEASLLLRHMF